MIWQLVDACTEISRRLVANGGGARNTVESKERDKDTEAGGRQDKQRVWEEIELRSAIHIDISYQQLEAKVWHVIWNISVVQSYAV